MTGDGRPTEWFDAPTEITTVPSLRLEDVTEPPMPLCPEHDGLDPARLWCPGTGVQEGVEGSTHHLVPRIRKSEQVQVCRTCGQTEDDLRRAADQAQAERVQRARHDDVMATADAVVRDAKTRDLLRTAYALTHRIHEARKAPLTMARTAGDYLPDLMASREIVSTEIRRRTRPLGHARALGLFIAPDGEDEPTLWQDRRTQDPVALARRCDVHEHVWAILTSTIDTREDQP